MDKKQDRSVGSILTEAEELIHGERVITYGPATETFKDIAIVASILTGKVLSPRDCLLVQISQKLIRDRVSPKNRDHRRDTCGYLGILDDVEMLPQAVVEPLSHNEIAAAFRAELERQNISIADWDAAIYDFARRHEGTVFDLDLAIRLEIEGTQRVLALFDFGARS